MFASGGSTVCVELPQIIRLCLCVYGCVGVRAFMGAAAVNPEVLTGVKHDLQKDNIDACTTTRGTKVTSAMRIWGEI